VFAGVMKDPNCSRWRYRVIADFLSGCVLIDLSSIGLAVSP
jgi:hypothetical protein